MESFNIAVIGAGAAGMMCASIAAQSGHRVVLIDHAERLAEKIRISGGGRCNFTNLNAQPANFLSANPHFYRSALARYTPRDFLALLKTYRVKWYEKHKGQLFCDDSSESIIDVLKSECDAGRVSWQRPVSVAAIRHDGARFALDTSAGEIGAAALVIATGGLSIPKIGATDFGYRVAKQFGYKLIDTRPALVPLTFTLADWAPFAALSGLSLPVRIATGKGKTARRIRRRLAADASRRVGAGRAADFELLEHFRADPRRSARRRCDRAAARRQIGLEEADRQFSRGACAGAARARVAGSAPGLARRAFRRSAGSRAQDAWRVAVELDADAERHRGLSQGGSHARRRRYARTVLCDPDERARSGTLFVGEAVDVTGWLGSYNFQWAWASGVAAGKAAEFARG